MLAHHHLRQPDQPRNRQPRVAAVSEPAAGLQSPAADAERQKREERNVYQPCIAYAADRELPRGVRHDSAIRRGDWFGRWRSARCVTGGPACRRRCAEKALPNCAGIRGGAVEPPCSARSPSRHGSGGSVRSCPFE